MRAIQIRDKTSDGRVLAFDLREALAALGTQALRTYWAVSGVADQGEALSATGDGGVELEELARSGARVSGARLLQIAQRVRQVIWGEFNSYDSSEAAEPRLVIRAIDSSCFEVRCDDETILARIPGAFADVRPAPKS